MNNVDQATLRKLVKGDLVETLFRVLLIALLAIICVQVFMPFSHLVILASILAIALYPLYMWVVRKFGGRRGLSATVLVLAALLLLGVPVVLLGASLVGQLGELHTAAQNDTLAIPAPDAKVAEWPIIGDRVYAAWNTAAADLPAFVAKNRDVIRGYAAKALKMAAGGAAAVGVFLLAIILAGVLMAYAEPCAIAIRRILVRLTDPEHGPALQKLSVATVRSVATGVVGVAFIQAILLGVGFLLAGIPGAGVLALIVMFLGILQLPALVVSLPVVAWLWMTEDGGSTAFKVAFSIWFIVAGMADNVLKPLLLGRGVDAPMLVILIGAIGGMVVGGMTGLFLGAVLLAVGYQLFMEWVDSASPPAAPMPPPQVEGIDTETPG